MRVLTLSLARLSAIVAKLLLSKPHENANPDVTAAEGGSAWSAFCECAPLWIA